MSALRIGSLFTGTGALDLAVMDVYGAEVVWHSQYEPPDKNGKEDKNQYAAKILARHWPDVPNLGDITKVDFGEALAKYGPVDIITAGFPCQPFSTAGRRLGYQDERWLWDDVARAVRELRPQFVLLENVPGLFTAPGRQPDCVCGWNLRWGRQLGHRLAGNERAYQVLADDDGADGEAARSECAVGDAGWAPWSGGPAESKAGLCGDAPVGVVWRDGAVPAGGDASVPPREEGSGDADLGDAWPRVAGFDEWARNLLDAGGLGGVAEGEAPDSDAEPAGDGSHGRGYCPACGRSMDDSEGGFVRRAVGDVLGSLSHLGLNAEWINLRASDVGAPHQRKRVFIYAWPAAAHAEAADEGWMRRGGGSAEPAGWSEPGHSDRPVADAPHFGHERGGFARRRGHGPSDCGLAAAHATGDSRRVGDGDDVRAGRRTDRRGQAPGRGEAAPHAGGIVPGDDGELPTGRDAVQRGLRNDAPRCGSVVADADDFGRRTDILDLRPGQPDLDWGDYGPAIRRWERILGRRAPWPTDAAGRLSPVFTEWLMGLPDGWVTDTPGLTRAAMLRALGNGVVRQQAAHALRILHARSIEDAGEPAA